MELCRLCNLEVNRQLSEFIFNEKLDPPIWKIITELANLTILQNDPYTKLVCFQCFDQLQQFYIFRKKVLYTDWKIRHNHHNKNNNNNNDNKQQLTTEIRDNINDYHTQSATIEIEDDDCMFIEDKTVIVEDPLKIDETQHIFDNFDKSNTDNNATINKNVINDNRELEHSVDVGVSRIHDHNSTKEDSNNNNNNNNKLEQLLQDVNCNSTKFHGDSPSNKTGKHNHILIEEQIKIEEDPLTIENEIDNNLNKTLYNDDNMVILNDQNGTNTNSIEINTSTTIENVKTAKIDKIRRFQCNKCNKRFLYKGNLNTHLRIHSGDKPYQCDICNIRFVHKCTLNHHLKLHRDEKPHQYILEEKSEIEEDPLANDNNDNEGIIDDRDETNNIESNCIKKEVDNNQKSIEIVEKVEHFKFVNNKRYQCNKCKKTFANKSNLNTHTKIHTGEKPYQCYICNRQFRTKQILENHLKVHSIEKYCKVCNKTFSTINNYRKHQKDSCERRFKCNLCDKRFFDKQSLIYHEKIHNNIKPYECNICSKRFLRKFCLIKHVRIHTGEKPYECSNCGRKFSNKSDMIRHSKRQIC